MDHHAFDHSLHHANADQNLHSNPSMHDLQEHNNLLNNDGVGIQYDPLKDHSNLGTEQPFYGQNQLDRQLTDSHLDLNMPGQHFDVYQSSMHGVHSQHMVTEQFHQPSSLLAHQNQASHQLQAPGLHQNHLLATHPESHQRQGFAGLTPSSPSDISTNKEVVFKDSTGHEQEGTVMHVDVSGDKFDIQTSDGNTHHNVPYHNIEQYRSK